jgi:hypothetical protein
VSVTRAGSLAVSGPIFVLSYFSDNVLQYTYQENALVTDDTLHLTLVRARDDEASFSPGYQAELRQFYHLARADGNRASAVTFALDRADGGDGFAGEFVIPFTNVGVPVLAAAADAWLLGRAGRRLRLTMGDVEVEAASAGELYGLLNLTMAVSKRQVKPEIDHV